MADDLSGPAPPSNDAIAPQQLTRTLAEAFPHGSSEWLTRLHSRLMSTMGSPLAHGGKQKFWGVHSITHPSIEVADDTATVESAAYIWALTLDGAPMTGHAQRVAQSMTQYTTTLTRVGDAWHVTNQTSRGS